MERMIFRIKGMCCGEEIAVLKRQVGPLVGGELNLAFDLLESKMTVLSPDEAVTSEKIREAVAQTGMEAVPWDEFCVPGTCGVEEGAWQRHGRLFMCGASGAFILAGFLLEAYRLGSFWDALSEGHAEALRYGNAAILLYTAAVVTGIWYVLPKALFAVRRLRPDMNLLMTVAVLGAMGIGQWLEAASVSFLFSLALVLESWSVGRARRAIKALVDISPTKARFICPTDGNIEEKPVEDIPVGVTVLVRPGEKIPLDGVVTKGITSVNQSPITGESAPVFKEPGDEVFAGTINAEGAIEFRSTRPASNTTLSRIIHMVEDAQARRAPVEQWVEKFALVYTPAMMVLALLIAVIPPVFLGGIWTDWFYQALVILVIACPCSLVISTPVSIVAGLTSAARNGVLIKGGAFLEAPARLKGIALDKTGTLTYGQPTVQQIIPTDNHTEEELLANAAALESHCTHPFARAILEHAQARGVTFPEAEDFSILPGQGAQGTIHNKSYWIGSHRLLEQWRHETPEFHEMATRLEDEGHSLVIMWCNDHVCGLMSVADQVRTEARQAISELKELGIQKIVMITGDNQRTAEQMAHTTGVDAYRAELLPEDKVRFVAELEEDLGNVAMVGDGVNDAPAMAMASVGIAMGAMGTDAAVETADIALMSDDLSKLPWLIRHSRRTLKVIKQNILFSLGIKLLFISMTLFGTATLWMAIAADMGASLLVIFNGLRLLRSKQQGQERINSDSTDPPFPQPLRSPGRQFPA
ncbi:MAG: heavy metal translocating P-type ATPase [Deltaproteobacteria bacterium]|jgi:Cd2+/Zn2+-exporting ATPase|uniref:P-type Zn(2+) transporter n=2 Tax=Desulforhabdus amnigena TaxID=40218 RepID=A0A9W6FSX9_9BACT|nr:heavy metal translocating P-type ATPase [Deltaproteobacteria bacterium]GLI32690.1 cadmium transporter [Desulforhabdus amnigena]